MCIACYYAFIKSTFWFIYSKKYNFNFRVELVLKNAYTHIIALSRKDSVYFCYLQKFSHAQFQSTPTPKSQGQACLICFVLLQIIISFSRDRFKCSQLVWILLYMVSIRGTKELIFLYIVAYITCLFLFLAEYHFSICTFKIIGSSIQ